jgi:hypothetical protein
MGGIWPAALALPSCNENINVLVLRKVSPSGSPQGAHVGMPPRSFFSAGDLLRGRGSTGTR